jgi:hypothetical protein
MNDFFAVPFMMPMQRTESLFVHQMLLCYSESRAANTALDF